MTVSPELEKHHLTEIHHPKINFEPQTPQDNSRWLGEIVQPHKLPQPGLQRSPVLFYHTKIGQQLALLGLNHYLNLLKNPYRRHCPQTTGSNFKNMMLTFPRGKMDGFGLFGGLWMLIIIWGISCKLLLVMVRKETEQSRLESGISF